jgi:drug/metabolite transporter (DMT)-like permease
MAHHTKAYLALAFISLIWGTTYLAIRVGAIAYPPFLFAGVRQTVAGLLLGATALIINPKINLSRQHLLRQMLCGFLLITLGNGCVTWGEKYIPSGIAALLCSMMPLFAVAFNLLLNKERPNLIILLGIVLGITGVGFIVKDDIGALANAHHLAGMGAILFATCSWALGSIINRKNPDKVNPLSNAAMQLLFGGLFMLLASPVVDDYSHFVLWHQEGFLALCYLIVFGSVLAYAAFMYSLTRLPVGIATVYAYINPLVAVIVGNIFLAEPLNVYTGLAFITIVASVFLVNKGYRNKSKAQA